MCAIEQAQERPVCALQSEGSGRVCKLALRDPSSAVATPVAIAILSSRLLFFASWLGHSNLVSYDFQEAEAEPASSQPAATADAAVVQDSVQPAAPPSKEQPSVGDAVAAQPVVVEVDEDRAVDVEMAAEPIDGPAVSSPVDGAKAIANPVVSASGDGTESIEQAAAVAAIVSNAGLSAQEPAKDGAQEAGGLGALLEQMQDPAGAEPASPAIELLSEPSSPVGVPGLAAAAADDADRGAGLKRPLEESGGRRSIDAATPLLKHARSASAGSAVPGSGVLPGLPFAGLSASGPVPGIGGAIPGLGGVASTRGDEAAQEPVAEDDAMLQDDHDDLEEALYQCAPCTFIVSLCGWVVS